MADEEKKTSAKSGKSDKNTKSDKAKDKKPKKNPFKSIVAFFKSVKAEGKKVIWSTGKDVFKNTLTVLVVVIIVGLCIYGVDSLLSVGMKGVKNLAETTTVSTTAATTSQSELTTQADTTAAATTQSAK